MLRHDLHRSVLLDMLCCRAYQTSSRSLVRSSHRRYRDAAISSSNFRLRCASSSRIPTVRLMQVGTTIPHLNLRRPRNQSKQPLRDYATLTELPPTASTSMPAPPSLPSSKSSRNSNVSPVIEAEALFNEEITALDPSGFPEPSSDAFGELYSIANSPRYSTNPDGLEDTPLPAGSVPAELLSTSKGVYEPQTTLKPRTKAQQASGKSKHATVIRQTLSPKEAIQSISGQPFESFRLQHRKAQYRLDYTWEGRKDNDTPHQPHHQSLESRYDWRLRTPWRTPDQIQKHAYGSKILFRKRPQASDALTSPELSVYQEKYRRFIALEREESERLALNGLRKSSKREASLFATAPVGPAEHLAGLQAVPGMKKRRFQTATESAEEVTEEDILQAETMTDYHQDSENRKLFLFSRPDRQELPSNTFHRGKMVFIWKCHWDNFLQDWIVPELQDTSLTLEQLGAIPARGYVHREWSNQIDIFCENFVPEPGETYR